MSGPPGPDETEHDWPHRDRDRAPDSPSGSHGADESAWDDWSRPSQPPGPSTEPISTWDDWPPPSEQEPAGELVPEPPISDPWAERWDVEPPSPYEPPPYEPPPYEPPPSPYEPPPSPYEPPPPSPYEPSAPWEAETEPVPAPEAAPMRDAEAEPMPEPEAEPMPASEPAPMPEPAPYQTEAPRWTSVWPTQPEVGPVAEEEAAAAEAELAAGEPPTVGEEPEVVEAPVTQEELEALEAPLADKEPAAAGAASAAELPIAEVMPSTGGAFGAEAEREAEAEAGAPAEDQAAAEPEPEEFEELEALEAPERGQEPESLEQQAEEEEPELEAQPPLAPKPDWRAEAPPAAETWQVMPQGPGQPDAEAEAIAEVPEMAEAAAEKGEDGIGAPAEEEDGAGGLLEPSEGEVETAPADAWAGIERRKPTTAESAVPWLVGIILLLAGMVVVLMALIFSGDQSLGGVIDASGGSPSAEPTPSPTPEPTPTPQPTPSPEPTPPPIVFGPLEMVYQGRAAALEPIYLLRHDFTTTLDPMVLAQDPALDVGRFDWAPDGSVGAALLGDFLVAIDPDLQKRTLATAISTLAFSDSPSTVYAVRVSAAGANDTATVLAIDFGSGTTLELAAVTYVRPEIVAETPLKDAQFIDEGGGIRLYWMEDGTMRLWVLGAGTWQVDPVSGATSEVVGEPLPTLWSPDGSKRIVVAESDTTSTLVLYRSGGTEVARTTVDGLVSHLRWAADGSQVNFTLARGSVRQDLFLWSLSSDTPPIQQTDTGAAFGAEWLGTKPLWKP